MDGADLTDYVVPDSLRITNILTSQVDTCEFTLDAVPGAVSLADWMTVIIYDGATILFGGVLMAYTDRQGSDLLHRYECQCADYSVRLGHVRVSREYTGYTDAQIIADIFSTYLAGEGWDVSTYVNSLATHDRVRYINKYVADVLRDLAKLSGGDWYIDPDQKLHYFLNEASTAPFRVSDAPDFIASLPYSNFEVNRDGSGVSNRVRVVGGTYYSQEVTMTVRGNGTDKRLTLPAKFRSGLRVFRNSGTDLLPAWNELTILAGYLDTLSTTSQALYFYQDKVVETLDAWPALDQACKVVGTYEVPNSLTVEMVDAASYAYYGAYLDEVIRDSNIVERSVAITRGMARLAEAALAKTVISFDCRQPGLRAGQLLTVANTLHGINGDYLIRVVTTTVGINGAARFSVECGVYSPDLIDYLLALARQKAGEAGEESQTAYELLTQAETLTLGSETTSVTATTAPYNWDAFNWDFGKWG